MKMPVSISTVSVCFASSNMLQLM